MLLKSLKVWIKSCSPFLASPRGFTYMLMMNSCWREAKSNQSLYLGGYRTLKVFLRSTAGPRRFLALPRDHVFFLSILKSAASPPLCHFKASWAECGAWAINNMRLGLATLVCFLSFLWLSDCAPPTCYSRALGLGKEIMALLDKIHTYHRTVITFALYYQLWI